MLYRDWADVDVLSKTGVNWVDLNTMTLAGVNWSDVDVLSKTGVNWVDLNAMTLAGVNWSDANIVTGKQWMSDTSIRRRVADLEAAGLNPMLAYSQGGAAVPGGAQASAVSPDAMINSGFKAAEVGTQQRQADATIANVSADTVNKQAQTENFKAQADNTRAQTELMRSQVPVQETTAAMQNSITEKNAQDIRESIARVEAIGHQNNWTDAQIAKVKAEIPGIVLSRNLIVAQTGETNARQVYTEKEARGSQLHNSFMELNFPSAVNQSKGEENYSWWRQHVTPLLPDILKGAGAGSMMMPRGGGITINK